MAIVNFFTWHRFPSSNEYFLFGWAFSESCFQCIENSTYLTKIEKHVSLKPPPKRKYSSEDDEILTHEVVYYCLHRKIHPMGMGHTLVELSSIKNWSHFAMQTVQSFLLYLLTSLFLPHQMTLSYCFLRSLERWDFLVVKEFFSPATSHLLSFMPGN
jgi:hypothetical protein